METFGSLIRTLRKKKNLGLREFAIKIGISPAYLTRIEQGKENAPTSKIIEKMAEVLRVDASELFKKVEVKGKRNNRLPSSITETYAETNLNKEKLPEFMRTIQGKKLTEEQWRKLIEEAKKISEE